MHDDIANVRRLSGVKKHMNFCDGLFKALEWIWVHFIWIKISHSPAGSHSIDEVSLIQGTNVSDACLICYGRIRMINCGIGCLGHYH